MSECEYMRERRSIHKVAGKTEPQGQQQYILLSSLRQQNLIVTAFIVFYFFYCVWYWDEFLNIHLAARGNHNVGSHSHVFNSLIRCAAFKES